MNINNSAAKSLRRRFPNIERIAGSLIIAVASLLSGSGDAVELPPGASRHFATINGFRMHYVTMGKGPTVVLLHGWPETWYEWRHVMPKLAEHWTVVAPDLRGLGESERTFSGYDKRTIALDVAALLDHLGAKKAAVVGHDMGCKAAYVLGLLKPERIDKLVLVDCSPPGRENMDVTKGGSWHYGFHMAADVPEMLTATRERAYIGAMFAVWLHRKDAVPDDVIDEYVRHYAEPGGMTAGFNYYRTLLEDGKFVASLPEPRFTMPVLTIAGRYSGAERLYGIMRPQAADLRGVIAERSGHFVAEEEPEFLAKELNQFLAR